MDPYYLAPLGARPVVARRAAGAGADRRGQGHRARHRRGRRPQPARREWQPARAGQRATSTSTSCSPSRTCARRCAATTSRRSPTARPRSCSRAGDKARELCRAAGVDHRLRPPHRVHHPGIRDLTVVAVDHARGRRRRARRRARSRWPSCRRRSRRRSSLLREALGLGDDVDGQPVGRRARRQPDHGHRPRPHHRGRPPDHRAGPRPRARPRDVGPVPATEPRLHPGGRRHEPTSLAAIVGIGQTQHKKAPRRRLVRRPRPRGREPRPRRRRHDVGRHRRAS